MFKHFNVFYSPNDVTGMPSAGSVGDVEPIGPTDKDILNGDDDGDEVPDNAGDGEDGEEGDSRKFPMTKMKMKKKPMKKMKMKKKMTMPNLKSLMGLKIKM